MKYQEVTLGRFLRIILVMLVVAISYFVLNSLSSVLLPFAVAWLLAYLLYPMVRFVQYKMRFKYRLPSIVAVLLFVLLLIVAAFMLVIPSMLDEFAQFKNIAVAFLNDNIKNPTIPPVAAEYMRNLARDEGLLNILSSAGVQDVIQELAHRAPSSLCCICSSYCSTTSTLPMNGLFTCPYVGVPPPTNCRAILYTE